MKKAIIFIAMLLITVIGAQAMVEEPPKVDLFDITSGSILTVFEGVVTDNEVPPSPLEDMKVTVMCTHDYSKDQDGSKMKTKQFGSTNTDQFGHFLKTSLNRGIGKRCVIGDEAFVKVEKKVEGEWTLIGTSNPVTVGPDLYMGTVPYGRADFLVGVPEFSTATMAIAVLGVTLGIVALRRKE